MFYIIVILAAIFTMPAKADETLKFRVVQYVATTQFQQVGDVNNHVVPTCSGGRLFPRWQHCQNLSAQCI